VTFEANFYHVLWRLLVTTPYVRNPTIVYLNERLPKPENLVLADKERPSPFKESLVVKGLVAALQDNNIFVLRLALDMLVNHFRLDRGLFGEVRLAKLVGATMAIVIKKYPLPYTTSKFDEINRNFIYFYIIFFLDQKQRRVSKQKVIFMAAGHRR
jgi:hypothetical protein